jgi:phage shock protein A
MSLQEDAREFCEKTFGPIETCGNLAERERVEAAVADLLDEFESPRIEELEQEVRETQDDLKRAESARDEYESEKDELERTESELRSEVRNLEDERDSLREQLSELQERYDALKAGRAEDDFGEMP